MVRIFLNHLEGFLRLQFSHFAFRVYNFRSFEQLKDDNTLKFFLLLELISDSRYFGISDSVTDIKL